MPRVDLEFEGDALDAEVSIDLLRNSLKELAGIAEIVTRALGNVTIPADAGIKAQVEARIINNALDSIERKADDTADALDRVRLRSGASGLSYQVDQHGVVQAIQRANAQQAMLDQLNRQFQLPRGQSNTYTGPSSAQPLGPGGQILGAREVDRLFADMAARSRIQLPSPPAALGPGNVIAGQPPARDLAARWAQDFFDQVRQETARAQPSLPGGRAPLQLGPGPAYPTGPYQDVRAPDDRTAIPMPRAYHTGTRRTVASFVDPDLEIRRSFPFVSDEESYLQSISDEGGGGGGGGRNRRGLAQRVAGGFDPGKPGSGLLRGFLPGGRRAGFGPIALGAAGAVGLAGPATEALAPLLPALANLGLAGGADIAILTTAFHGLGKAIGGNKDEFDKLDPVAQKFVQTLRSYAGPLKTVQQAARVGLFPGLEKGIAAAGTVQNLALLTNGAHVLGQALGSVAQEWGRGLGSTGFASKASEFLPHFALWTTQGGDSLNNMASALFSVMHAALPFTDWLSRSLNDGSRFLSVWTKNADTTGKLGGFFAKAAPELSLFAHLIIALATAVGQLAIDLEPLGHLLMVDLTAALQSVSKWLKENHDKIVEITTGALQAFVELIKVAVPLIGHLWDGLTKIVDVIGGWKDAFELLIGLAVAAKIAEMTANVWLLVTAEEAATGKAVLLRKALLGIGSPEVLAALGAAFAAYETFKIEKNVFEGKGVPGSPTPGQGGDSSLGPDKNYEAWRNAQTAAIASSMVDKHPHDADYYAGGSAKANDRISQVQSKYNEQFPNGKTLDQLFLEKFPQGIPISGKDLKGTNEKLIENIVNAVKAVGGTEIVITSAKRPPGPGNDVKNSNHITGNAVDGYAIINGEKVPLGVAIQQAQGGAAAYGLRSGNTAGFDPKIPGGYDPYHVDDAANSGGVKGASTFDIGAAINKAFTDAQSKLYAPIAAHAAEAYGVPVDLFLAQIKQESGFNPRVTSGAGAQGIAQFMPGTAASAGLKPGEVWDPNKALPASARLMAKLFQKYGSWDLALAAYNAGEGTVDKYLNGKGTLPAETQAYVKTITGSPLIGQFASRQGDPLTGLKPGAWDPSTKAAVPFSLPLNLQTEIDKAATTKPMGDDIRAYTDAVKWVNDQIKGGLTPQHLDEAYVELASLQNSLKGIKPVPKAMSGQALGDLVKTTFSQFAGLAQYKGLFAFKASPPSPKGYMSESYQPGETGSFDPAKRSIELYGMKNKPADVAGEIVSHFLTSGVSKPLTDLYKQFAKTITPDQMSWLKRVYKSEGIDRPFSEYKKVDGLPSLFRGSLFGQLDKGDVTYTKQQIDLFEKAKFILTTPLPQGTVGGTFRLSSPAARTSGQTQASNVLKLLVTDPLKDAITPTSIGQAEKGLHEMQSKLLPIIRNIKKEMASKWITPSELSALRAQLAQYSGVISDELGKAKAAVAQLKSDFHAAFQAVGDSAINELQNSLANFKSPSQMILDALVQAHDDQALQDALDQANKDLADALVPVPDNQTIVDNIKAIIGQYAQANVIDQIQSAILGGTSQGIDSSALIRKLQTAVNVPGVSDPEKVKAAQKNLAEAEYNIKVSGLQKQANAERDAYQQQIDDLINQIGLLEKNWDGYFTSLGGNINGITGLWASMLASIGVPQDVIDKVKSGAPQVIQDVTGITTTDDGGSVTADVGGDTGYQDVTFDPGTGIVDAGASGLDTGGSLYGGSVTYTVSGGQVTYSSGKGNYGGKHLLAEGGVATARTDATIGEAGREAILPLTDARSMAMIRDALGLGGLSVENHFPEGYPDWMTEQVLTVIKQNGRVISQSQGRRASDRLRSNRL